MFVVQVNFVCTVTFVMHPVMSNFAQGGASGGSKCERSLF